MENVKKQNWLMNFIKAFTTSEGNDDGRVSEEKLSQEDKDLLATIRKMDRVKNIEESMKFYTEFGSFRPYLDVQIYSIVLK